MAERAVTMARRLVDLREIRDDAKTAYDKAEKNYRDAERDFWERMHDEEDTTRTLDLGEGYGKIQFQRRQTIRGRVLDKDRAAKALEELHLTAALTEPIGFRKGALNDHVREWLKNGDPLPDGLDFSRTRFVTITRK